MKRTASIRLVEVRLMDVQSACDAAVAAAADARATRTMTSLSLSMARNVELGYLRAKIPVPPAIAADVQRCEPFFRASFISRRRRRRRYRLSRSTRSCARRTRRRRRR
eukprot:30666-Pelagococcus_subviridis.AAC.5